MVDVGSLEIGQVLDDATSPTTRRGESMSGEGDELSCVHGHRALDHFAYPPTALAVDENEPLLARKNIFETACDKNRLRCDGDTAFFEGIFRAPIELQLRDAPRAQFVAQGHDEPHRKRQLEERMLAKPGQGLWRDSNLVFPTETGSLFNPSNLRNRSFKRIKACSAPLVRDDLRFYDLRHTCATLLLGEGVNAKVVSELLGHASITITLNTYSHVLPDMQDTAADAMEAALGSLATP